MVTLASMNEVAKEVFDIEANSILRLKNNIGEEFDKAMFKNSKSCANKELPETEQDLEE